MKLRNKKTGIVVEFFNNTDGIFPNSLAELEEEWEDYEEAKEPIHVTGPVEKDDNTVLIEFYTHEEAEKAAEKLKAWTRLKEKGFRFTGFKKIYQGRSSSPINYTESPAYISFNKATEDFVSPIGNWVKENWDDLQLLFGGEE